jgi:hypothetical protein
MTFHRSLVCFIVPCTIIPYEMRWTRKLHVPEQLFDAVSEGENLRFHDRSSDDRREKIYTCEVAVLVSSQPPTSSVIQSSPRASCFRTLTMPK